MRSCTGLTVKGDFRFGRDVILAGNVALINESGKAFDLDDERRLHGTLRVHPG